MTSVPTSSSTLATSGYKYVDPIIDADAHETMSSWEDLLPYLTEPWRGLIEHKAWSAPSPPYAYWASHGVNRADSFPESGAPPGASYDSAEPAASREVSTSGG